LTAPVTIPSIADVVNPAMVVPAWLRQSRGLTVLELCRGRGVRIGAPVAPARVLLGEAEDQDSYGSDGAWPVWAVWSGHLGVVSAYQVAVPAQDRVWAYQ
jgi:hypothetical protein